MTIQVIPTNKLITIKNMYAELGSLNMREAQCITGDMHQPYIKKRTITAGRFSLEEYAGTSNINKMATMKDAGTK